MLVTPILLYTIIIIFTIYLIIY